MASSAWRVFITSAAGITGNSSFAYAAAVPAAWACLNVGIANGP
ncbi:hypothetical protein Alg130_11001 [Pyrenophora tritici-repentis]|nr:hypothetical protein PtrV1_05083 [Pyrenophora tritici-repentis]KAF7574032.1 hypothetical protein PtrM4_056550 [Pyrenophora tritici-repentis]KAI0571100.1 hypothetical protein Alg130_11001 [Pyrenophora tritici-repentis]